MAKGRRLVVKQIETIPFHCGHETAGSTLLSALSEDFLST